MKSLFIIFIFVFLTSSMASAKTITYTDKMGRIVTVSVPVNRAILFNFPDLIPALGIWDKVVGVASWAYDNDLMKAIKPDIIITWSKYTEAVRFIEEKGLKVIAVAPENTAELYEVMRLHGRLFSKEEKVEYVISEMENIFKIIKDRVSKVPTGKKKKVLWLYNKPTLVACGVGNINDTIKLIGGINATASIPQPYADVSKVKKLEK